MQNTTLLNVSRKGRISHQNVKTKLLILIFFGSELFQSFKALSVSVNPFYIFIGFVTPAVKIQSVQMQYVGLSISSNKVQSSGYADGFSRQNQYQKPQAHAAYPRLIFPHW